MHTRFPCFLLIAALCVPLSGCQIFGLVAQAIPKYVDAKYAGLKGNDTAVMVWADRPIMIDWPSVEMDINASLLKKLQTAQQDDNPADLKGATFPVSPQSIARFQLEHPEAEMSPITEVARQVGVKRLIYIEVNSFQTRPDQAVTADLFHGKIIADLQVIELDHPTPMVGYMEHRVISVYPPKSPEEGTLNIGDARTYVGTIDTFSDDVAKRFYKHEEERAPGE